MKHLKFIFVLLLISTIASAQSSIKASDFRIIPKATGSRPAGVEGQLFTDVTTHRIQYKNNSAWANMCTPDSTDTFTNKTFDADGSGNSITNIENADIKAAAAIDASKIANGNVSSAEFQRLDGVTSGVQTQIDSLVTNAPPGIILDYAGSTEPTGWLFCYGQAVSRTTYAALFAAIGTAYGAGDGSTTFNLPDLRGRVAAGRDDMGGAAASRLTNTVMTPDGVTLGAVGGTQTHVLTEAQIPAHVHSNGASLGGSGLGGNGGSWVSSSTNTGSAGSGAAHLNTQPTLVLNKIIKHGG